MAYNLIISEHADELIENIIQYMIHKLVNHDAAKHFVDSLDSVYDRLENNPYAFRESEDPLLYRRGYREAHFMDMNYKVIFRIDSQNVYIVGIFHDLEDYGKKVLLND